MKRGRKRSAPRSRWNQRLRGLRALSIRQPFAWLIVNGFKDVENRSWHTRYRGPVLIHAGASRAWLNDKELSSIERRYGIKLPRAFDTGGVVGAADIVDCRLKTTSPWHQRGAVGWILTKPRRLSFRPCKGALSFFRPVFE